MTNHTDIKAMAISTANITRITTNKRCEKLELKGNGAESEKKHQ